MSQLNVNDRNIRLTYSYHMTTLPFPDLLLTRVDNKITTQTYHEETAANSLLLAQTQHPKSLIHEIPTGQFLRISRNCSEDHYFLEEAEDMYSEDMYRHFRNREYPHKPLRKAKSKALKCKLKKLLQNQEKVRKDQGSFKYGGNQGMF